MDEKKEMVNSPIHYNHGNMECINGMIGAFGNDAVMDFCKINAFKYLWRLGHKDDEAQEIGKIKWYLDKYLELKEKSNPNANKTSIMISCEDNIKDDEVVHDVLKTHIVNAYRVKLNSYTTDELVSKREEFEASVEDYLRNVLLKENFELGEMTSGLKYPESLEKSITAKNEAVQNALRIENEVAAIEEEAKKQVAAAKGRADAKKIEADGEAYYNRTVSASLTPALVNIKALEKWDGKTPVVAGGSGTFIDASKFVR